MCVEQTHAGGGRTHRLGRSFLALTIRAALPVALLAAPRVAYTQDCTPGTGWDGGECVACTACATYGPGGASACLAFTQSYCAACSTTVNECISCLPGYGFSAGMCTPCTMGYYSPGGTGPCDANTAVNCLAKSTTANECISCLPGYGFSAGMCTPCLAGYYSPGGTTSCYVNAAANCLTKSTTANECISCLAGYGYDGGVCSACTECSDYSPGETSACLSFTQPDCATCSLTADECSSCPAGYGFDQGVCTVCAACSGYSPGGTSACLSFTQSDCATCSLTADGCLDLNGTFELANVLSEKCLEVAGASTDNGANIEQSTCTGGTNQQWRLIERPNGTYRIRSMNSNKCMRAAGNASGDNIQQGRCVYNRSKWQLAPVGGDEYELISFKTGLCADVADGSTADAANLQQWSCTADDRQRFTLLPVGQSASLTVSAHERVAPAAAGQFSPDTDDDAHAVGCAFTTPENGRTPAWPGHVLLALAAVVVARRPPRPGPPRRQAPFR